MLAVGCGVRRGCQRAADQGGAVVGVAVRLFRDGLADVVLRPVIECIARRIGQKQIYWTSGRGYPWAGDNRQPGA